MQRSRRNGIGFHWILFTATATAAAIGVDAIAAPGPTVGFALAGLLGVAAAVAAMRAARRDD